MSGELPASTSKLDIWITNEGDPCGVSTFPFDLNLEWQIVIWECSGRVLEWWGQAYTGLPAPGGHLLVDVPPGRYIVRAAVAWHKLEPGTYGNDWTDHGVVTVCCGETACVTLYAPAAHSCHLVEELVLERLEQHAGGDVAQAARDALPHIRRLVQLIEPTAFERNQLPSLAKLAESAESASTRRAEGNKRS